MKINGTAGVERLGELKEGIVLIGSYSKGIGVEN